MAEYYNVTTNIGDAEITKAIANNTKLDITHIAFGDGNGSVPTPSKIRTTLVKEVHRQAVTKYERHPTIQNWIVIETVLPSNIGGFWVREIGIIANGKLISHGSHAPFEKVDDPSGVSEYRLKFTQDVRDGNVVSITLDQSLIYVTQAWVEENYIKRNEIIDNLTSSDVNKPLSAAQGKKLQDNKLDKTANAVSASKLLTARTIQFSGAATGSTTYDGSANSSCILMLANSGVVVGSYGSALKIPVITVNAKGLLTVVAEKDIPIINDLTTGGATNILSAEQGKVLNQRITDIPTYSLPTATDKIKGGVKVGAGLTIANEVLAIETPLLYAPIPYPKTVAPTGYLVMMGQTITQGTYPILYGLYGSKLPDLRGQVIRGWDNGRGIDSGRVILSEQEDAIRNITGTVGYFRTDVEKYTTSAGAFTRLENVANTSFTGNVDIRGAAMRFDASNVVPTAAENRVKNIAFNYIVKAG